MYKAIIYGGSVRPESNSYSEIALSTLLACVPDLICVEFKHLGLFAIPTNEDDIKEGINRIKLAYQTLRDEFKIPVFPYTYPVYAGLANMEAVVNKNYIWLDPENFPDTEYRIRNNQTLLIDVVRQGLNPQYSPPNFTITLDLIKRKIKPK